ncbi:hypothetical protein ACFQY7_19820 [Actinomadura luteofluorescens]|uniref:hypothetical protein n=1 Tax=Actinomadura luteofluorescens TaxID=46163 RepID=UPI003642826F
MVVSYLVPTMRDWVDELRADPAVIGLPPYSVHRWMLFCALGGPEQADPAVLPLGFYDRRTSVVATLVDGVGPAGAVPLVAGALEGQYTDTDTYRSLLDVLARLPVDEAFQALVDRARHKYVQPALLAAARAYPRRALRLLAPAAGTPEAEDILRAHLLTHPELVEEMLPELPAESRAAVDALRETIARVPEASGDALRRCSWTRRGPGPGRRPSRSSSRTWPRPARAASPGSPASGTPGRWTSTTCGGG